MIAPPMASQVATTPNSKTAAPGTTGRFAGKRVAMVTFSAYPFDPRPRRAIDALVSEGATVDLICLEGDAQPRRENRPNIRVSRIPLKHMRLGKWD